MILNVFDDFKAGLFAGTNMVVDNGISFFKSFLDALIQALFLILDTISAPFGFKLSDVLSSFADFCVGIFNLFKNFFTMIPMPFSSLFFLSFLFLFCLLIYKLIRG